MPMGKGTYGSKRGRPPKKNRMTAAAKKGMGGMMKPKKAVKGSVKAALTKKRRGM